MTLPKRLFDIALALVLGTILFIPTVGVVLWLMRGQGGPILYKAERMKTPARGFLLWKFRTMATGDKETGVTGGDKSGRITEQGALMRRYRIDEIPQLWNVLKGDISFVGPRPPLREYVEAFPELYAQVLQSRPGITGLASLTYAQHEERLLSRAMSAGETDAIYRRLCVPMKAKLDLIYQREASLCFDIRLIWLTAGKFLPGWLANIGELGKR